MSLSRRKFAKLTLLGGASLAASSGILFPKPAESLSLDFLIEDAGVRNVMVGLVAYAGVRLVDAVFSPRQEARPAITVAENTFAQNGFTEEITPYGKIRDHNLIWGQEKPEPDPLTRKNVPNPGFAVVDEYNYSEPILFTASTTVGIETATKVLKEQYKLSPDDINDILIPTQGIFEDIATWQGDNDPTIGSNPRVGFTVYRSRGAEITRRYERLDPSRGRIQMNIDSPILKASITTNVKFA